jgi:hypothetical protein
MAIRVDASHGKPGRHQALDAALSSESAHRTPLKVAARRSPHAICDRFCDLEIQRCLADAEARCVLIGDRLELQFRISAHLTLRGRP